MTRPRPDSHRPTVASPSRPGATSATTSAIQDWWRRPANIAAAAGTAAEPDAADLGTAFGLDMSLGPFNGRHGDTDSDTEREPPRV